MKNTILKISNLSCSYERGSFALKNISCEFRSSRLYGIIGPNGSGKTTLLRAISAVLKIKSGTIELNDKNIITMSPIERARTFAIVQQESPSPFEMIVLDYVLLGRIPHRKSFSFLPTKHDLAIAENALQKCSAANFANRILSELSGGERQLVHIARALAQEPQILFLDEPTNHLDLAHQHQIMSLLKNLAHQEDLTVITILHDLNLTARFCDELLLFNNGSLVASGTPEQILKPEVLEPVYLAKIAAIIEPINNKPLLFTPL